jgi:hypothetical protein
MEPADRPATDLASLIGRFVRLHNFIKGHVFSDGPKTVNVIEQLLDIDANLDIWESMLEGKWLFRTVAAPDLPPRAIFEGEYHVYHDLWVGRILNHYRWARILVNQALMDLVDRYPMSSLPLISAAERESSLETTRRLARDVLLSTPSHWKHPALDVKTRISVETPGRAGPGAVGIPVLILQLKVAACAPGVPIEYWDWALDNLQCIWSDMGMLHAHSMMEMMRAHQDALQRSDSEGILCHDR